MFYRVVKSLGIKPKSYLKEQGYPTEPKNDEYYVWEIRPYSKKKLMDIRIVSGGQEGVGQGALEAAVDLGLEWGGWMPKGGKIEYGLVETRFRGKMKEHASADFSTWMRQNIVDSHATLVVADSLPLTGDTLQTKRMAESVMRSHFVATFSEKNAVAETQKWLRQFFEDEYPVPFILHVVGAGEAKSPGIQSKTRRFIAELIRTM